MNKIILLIYFSFSIAILSAQKVEIGMASFYADKFDGRNTASGAVFRQNKLTGAHRTLAFGSKVRVTNLDNKKTVEIIINDRGPFVDDRIIDLSKSAARKLDFIKSGVVKVKIEVLSGTPNGENDKGYTQAPNKQVLEDNKTRIDNVIDKQSNVEYYEVATRQVPPPTGFGIQVASYRELANLIKRCDNIKNKTNKNVLVQIGKTNGKKIYRIIVGPFSTREKANDFNENLKNTFEGSFVFGF